MHGCKQAGKQAGESPRGDSWYTSPHYPCAVITVSLACSKPAAFASLSENRESARAVEYKCHLLVAGAVSLILISVGTLPTRSIENATIPGMLRT